MNIYHIFLLTLFLQKSGSKKIFICENQAENCCTFFNVTLQRMELDYSLHSKQDGSLVKVVHFEKSTIPVLTDVICSSFPAVWDLRLLFMGIEIILPEAFQKCLSLKMLNLHENKLAHLSEETFAKQKLLKVVRISHNRLEWISTKHFSSSSNTLEYLDLSGNHLKVFRVDPFSESFPTLTYLNLSYNQLLDLHAMEILFKLQNLEEISLIGNEILCSIDFTTYWPIFEEFEKSGLCTHEEDFAMRILKRTNQMIITENKQIGTLRVLLSILQFNSSTMETSIHASTKTLFSFIYIILVIMIVFICVAAVTCYLIRFYLNRKILYQRPEATYYRSYNYELGAESDMEGEKSHQQAIPTISV